MFYELKDAFIVKSFNNLSNIKITINSGFINK